MDSQRADSPADALMRFLNTLIQHRDSRSVEELRESVKTMGLDPDRLVRRAQEQISKAREDTRLAWVTRARVLLPEIRRQLESTKSAERLTKEEQLYRIREAATGTFGVSVREFVASFHKFEDLPDADLASLVDDIEALRLLEDDPPNDRT